jgi:LmbE family N-acetylglucosaminyl deacetylase
MKPLLAWLVLAAGAAAQTWQETCGRTPAGVVALRQAVRDAGADSLVLLVASHPDDRYPLPAVWLRSAYGLRTAVLLATRGGGGQNSSGPETGDALERIRTLEAEAGCRQLQTDVWYLNRPDGGYRRSAVESFAEWGRDETLRELVRLLRRIRPDAVVSTHHREEPHGHDLALVELLPEAIRLAADPGIPVAGPPHRIDVFLLGAGSTVSPRAIRIAADHLDLDRGITWRRRAYDLLRTAHTSPGAPAPMAAVFGSMLELESQLPGDLPLTGPRPLRLPSLFDPAVWPGDPSEAQRLDQLLGTELPGRFPSGQLPTAELLAARKTLLARRDQAGFPHERIQRRLAAIDQVLLLAAGIQIELELAPGTVAIAGEEFAVGVQLHAAGAGPVPLRAEGLDGVVVELVDVDDERPTRGDGLGATGGGQWTAMVRPLGLETEIDPMAARYRADRFVPPVRILFHVGIDGTEIPIEVAVPVEQRAAVEMQIVPRMLLLPTQRQSGQFSVSVTRNTRFPVEGDLEVRAPAGYALPRDRHKLVLHEQRSDLIGFVVEAPAGRKPGVDVLRIRLGATRVTLPVHTIEVATPPGLRVGLLRSRDDTLPSVLGVGGLGIDWSDLSDADIAVADLRAFDTIAVDIRALRDRPAARRGFRRLLDFAAGKGHRLVVFYQKDVEFQPPGEGFVGAPHAPFLVGRSRVTRADSPVRMLRADHVLLQRPNRIQPSDWDGWEQERALYLPSVYGTAYEEVLELQDPGQPIERGALLYARAGEGEYVYCALALWRQLKKLHPGAVRLLANLLSPSK